MNNLKLGPFTNRTSTLSSTIAIAAMLLGALLWATWPALCVMAERWSNDPRYAHGYLVPLFSLYLLWHRREQIIGAKWSPSWWGLLPLLAGAIFLIAGGYYYFAWFEAVALVPMAVGVAMLIGGMPALKWAWPSVAFLGFMLPLPYRLEVALAGPLQSIATMVSTYSLQTLGLAAVAEGNVIHLDHGPIEVVEACGGLGMLFTFVAMATGMAILIRRPLLDKFLILASAIPIALTANVVRITATGVIHELVNNKATTVAFHDVAGWLMMPLALGLMACELTLLRLLLVPGEEPPIGDQSDSMFGKGKRQVERLSSTEEVIKRALGAR